MKMMVVMITMLLFFIDWFPIRMTGWEGKNGAR